MCMWLVGPYGATISPLGDIKFCFLCRSLPLSLNTLYKKILKIRWMSLAKHWTLILPVHLVHTSILGGGGRGRSF